MLRTLTFLACRYMDYLFSDPRFNGPYVCPCILVLLYRSLFKLWPSQIGSTTPVATSLRFVLYVAVFLGLLFTIQNMFQLSPSRLYLTELDWSYSIGNPGRLDTPAVRPCISGFSSSGRCAHSVHYRAHADALFAAAKAGNAEGHGWSGGFKTDVRGVAATFIRS
jgi:hypothetical protein